MAVGPESGFNVWIEEDLIVCLPPDGAALRLRISDLEAVYFVAGDGPFDPDWWILEGALPAIDVCFPLGSAGEAEVLARLGQMPGFGVLGMNSMVPGRHLCWQKQAPNSRSIRRS